MTATKTLLVKPGLSFHGWSHKPSLLNGRLGNCKVGGCKEPANPLPTLRQPFVGVSQKRSPERCRFRFFPFSSVFFRFFPCFLSVFSFVFFPFSSVSFSEKKRGRPLLRNADQSQTVPNFSANPSPGLLRGPQARGFRNAG